MAALKSISTTMRLCGLSPSRLNVLHAASAASRIALSSGMWSSVGSVKGSLIEHIQSLADTLVLPAHGVEGLAEHGLKLKVVQRS